MTTKSSQKSHRQNYAPAILRHLPEDVVCDLIDSPVGRLWLIASEKGLHSISWEQDFADKEFKKEIQKLKKSPRQSVISKTKKQLKEYFAGQRKDFDLPLAADGTEFQRKAWKQLQKIPYGKTISYQEQAGRLGDIKKCRAVGMANSRNPISIVVPCHRVIAKSGKLQGFAGGLDTKQFLLNLEAE